MSFLQSPRLRQFGLIIGFLTLAVLILTSPSRTSIKDGIDPQTTGLPPAQRTSPGQQNTPGGSTTAQPGLSISPTGSNGDLRDCDRQDEAAGLLPPDYETAPGAILEFLNRGGDIEALDAWLASAGIASVPTAVWADDMTGDGLLDVALSIFNPAGEGVLPPGMLLIFQCSDGEYKEVHRRPSESGAGPPHLWYLEDMDANQTAELVWSEAFCGVNTCFESVQVLAWDGGGFRDLLRGPTDDLPTPDIRLEPAIGGAGSDLVIASGGILSAAAGPQRLILRRWAFDPRSGLLEVSQETKLPSDFRIHVLHDAEDAAASGDDEAARSLYARVASDSSLTDWPDPEEVGVDLGAYARYKMILIYLRNGRDADAATILSDMESLYPPGESQQAYVELAKRLMQGFASGSAQQGCFEALEYAVDHQAELLEPLGPAVFGFTNREFTLDDVCPG